VQELVIGNGTVVTLGDKNRLIPRGAVAIKNHRIVEVNEVSAFVGRYPGARFIDARGGLIMPGFINAHTHFYGAFARGMALRGEAPRDFQQILESLWWRLDKALLGEDVRYSALLGLADCIRKGTTTFFDHHASPNAVAKSLDLVGDAVIKSGLRGCLCYEVSDRDGKDVARKGIEENERFLLHCKAETDKHEGRLASAFGLHASFTVDDDTLGAAAAVCRKTAASIHVHMAEGAVDVETSVKKYGARPLERLRKAGLLERPAMLAHCVHLDAAEHAVVAETKSWVLHNPQSNMNNAVGTAPIPAMLDAGVRVALGTDGMTADMLQEIRCLGLLQKQSTLDPRTLTFGQLYDIAFRANSQLAESFFGIPVGVIKPQAAADLIIVDYTPPTPLTDDNFLGHLFFGIVNADVRTTIVNGRILMEEGCLTTLDDREIAARARELAPKVWQRLE
jgi:putative selenium metabolism protein SsnA